MESHWVRVNPNSPCMYQAERCVTPELGFGLPGSQPRRPWVARQPATALGPQAHSRALLGCMGWGQRGLASVPAVGCQPSGQPICPGPAGLGQKWNRTVLLGSSPRGEKPGQGQPLGCSKQENPGGWRPSGKGKGWVIGLHRMFEMGRK